MKGHGYAHYAVCAGCETTAPAEDSADWSTSPDGMICPECSESEDSARAPIDPFDDMRDFALEMAP